MTDPVDSMPNPVAADRLGLRVLSLEECLQHIRGEVLGRVAFSRDGEVVVFPVNHVLDGLDVAFRTSWGSKLQLAADAGRIGFEVDGHDRGAKTGWSVLVQGDARIVDDEQQLRRLEEAAPSSWIPANARAFWVRIRPSEVSGRALGPSEAL